LPQTEATPYLPRSGETPVPACEVATQMFAPCQYRRCYDHRKTSVPATPQHQSPCSCCHHGHHHCCRCCSGCHRRYCCCWGYCSCSHHKKSMRRFPSAMGHSALLLLAPLPSAVPPLPGRLPPQIAAPQLGPPLQPLLANRLEDWFCTPAPSCPVEVVSALSVPPCHCQAFQSSNCEMSAHLCCLPVTHPLLMQQRQ